MPENPLILSSLGALETLLFSMADIPGEMPGLTELDHALQCAHLLKIMAPDDDALQIAGLVHDIGQAVGRPHDHELVAAAAVYPLLGARIADLVRLHVAAKRYLISTEPDYQQSLSPVSREGLSFQGGAMTASEIAAFEANRHSQDAARLRKCDDGAKQPGLAVPGLSAWLAVLRRVAGSSALN